MIDEAGVDFPRTFGNLTQDANTNTILNAIQNRSQHLNVSAFNGRWTCGRILFIFFLLYFTYKKGFEKIYKKSKTMTQPKNITEAIEMTFNKKSQKNRSM
jgi:hypothetical protein